MAAGPVLTYPQAARYLKRSERQLRRHVRAGRLAYVPNGRRIGFLRADLDAFLLAERVAPIVSLGERRRAQPHTDASSPWTYIDGAASATATPPNPRRTEKAHQRG